MIMYVTCGLFSHVDRDGWVRSNNVVFPQRQLQCLKITWIYKPMHKSEATDIDSVRKTKSQYEYKWMFEI